MSTYFADLSLTQLEVHPKNVRRDVGIVTDLANSITAKGLLQPLVVAPKPGNEDKHWSNERFVIIGGHRRHAAAKLAGLQVIPCVVREDLTDEASQLEAMLVENTQRTDLTVTEEAAAYQALLEFPGYNVKRVAKETGRSQKLVRERVALSNLPDAAKEKLDARTMTVERAIQLTEFADDQEATDRLLRVATSDQSNWDYYRKSEEERRAWAARIPELRDELTAAGIDVIDRPKGNSWEWKDWFRTTVTSIEAAAEHGCSAIVDTEERNIVWVRPRNAQPATAVPEPTPEELAEAEKIGRMTAGLGLAKHVRAEHLQAVVRNPPKDAARAAMERLVLDLPHEYDDFAELLGISQDLDLTDAVGDAVRRLTLDQLVMLLFINHRSEESRFMSELRYWNPEVTGWGSTTEWRSDLTDVLGYNLSDIEQEVLDYHAAKNAYRDEASDDAA